MKSFDNVYRSNIQRVYQANVFENVENEKLNENDELDTHYKAHHDKLNQSIWYDRYNNLKWVSNHSENYQKINFVITTSQLIRKHQCIKYNIIYSSRNLLFKHLHDQCWVKTTIKNVIKQSQLKSYSVNYISLNIASFNKSFKTTIMFIVVLNQFKKSVDYIFKNWRYAMIKLRLKFYENKSKLFRSINASNQSKIKTKNCCLDFECFVILNNRNFLQHYLNNIMMIYRLISLLLIREINDKMLKTSKYVMTYVCIDVIDFEQFITTRFLAKIYLIDDLTANLLFVTNVIISQQIILNFKNRVICIDICNVIVFIDIMTRKNFNIKRTVRIKKVFVVIFNQTINVLIIY